MANFSGKRIQRSSNKESLLNELKDKGLFKDFYGALIFAALLGFQESRREKLVSPDSGKAIDQSVFGNCGAWPGIMYLLSLVETENSDILSNSPKDDEKRVAIFQEYANGGLEIMQEYFSKTSITLDSFLGLMERYNKNGESMPFIGVTI